MGADSHLGLETIPIRFTEGTTTAWYGLLFDAMGLIWEEFEGRQKRSIPSVDEDLWISTSLAIQRIPQKIRDVRPLEFLITLFNGLALEPGKMLEFHGTRDGNLGTLRILIPNVGQNLFTPSYRFTISDCHKLRELNRGIPPIIRFGNRCGSRHSLHRDTCTLGQISSIIEFAEVFL